MKLTQENKDKWLTRLRDPASKQATGCGLGDMGGLFSSPGLYPGYNPDAPMCCLGHLEFALIGVVTKNYGKLAFVLLGPEEKNRLITMNDVDDKNLPEIADYVERNIPAVQE